MAYDYETLQVEVDGGVAVVTLNRPQVLNALNDRMVTELLDFTATARADDDVRVVILTGSGEKAFAAGADIGELAQAEGVRAVDLARKGQRMTRNLERLGKPVIAAVNGFALGGGCELAMACTIRLASETALFGQPEVNLGIIPGYGGTQRLTRLVGKGRAMDLVLTGRNVSADEAVKMGLVSQVVPPEGLMEAARKVAGKLMEKGPVALRLCMEAIHTGLGLGLDDALAYEAQCFGVAAGTADCREGLNAFLEKRKPTFTGK